MSATFFPSIDNRIDRSVPKFGARCTITRPIFPLGIGLGVGLGLPKSLGNACALLAPTRIAHAKTKITNALGKKFIAPNLSRCLLVFYFETRRRSHPLSLRRQRTGRFLHRPPQQ